MKYHLSSQSFWLFTYCVVELKHVESGELYKAGLCHLLASITVCKD
jgi:hypothetical protein